MLSFCLLRGVSWLSLDYNLRKVPIVNLTSKCILSMKRLVI